MLRGVQVPLPWRVMAPLGLSPRGTSLCKRPFLGKEATGWHRQGLSKEAPLYMNTLVRFGRARDSVLSFGPEEPSVHITPSSYQGQAHNTPK